MKLNYKHVAFYLIAAIVMILAMEAVLQVLLLASPGFKATLAREPIALTTITDERLGHRPNPKHPEHDSRGWRNKRVPDRSAIVALGDSQTYGINVVPFQAWPQQLEVFCGLTVYNMAYGGYSPAHYLLLLDEALALKPQLIIATLYTGNDLWESFHLVHDSGQLPSLKASLMDRAGQTISGGESGEMERKLTNLTDQMMRQMEAEPTIDQTRGKLREFLADNSKLYGVFRLSRRFYESIVGLDINERENWDSLRAQALLHKDDLLMTENGPIRAVLSPKYRLGVLDLDNAIIREGLRISLTSLELLNQRVKSERVVFMVLLIPTKELVFKEEVYRSSKRIPESYAKLLQNEELVWKEAKDFLTQRKIPFVDSLEALRECLRKGRNPYLQAWDGHPNAIGYAAIAASVSSELDNLLGKR
jgi:lysophospholipase L1-like esterase